VFGKRIPLFKVFGFEVGIDFSWFFLLVLITWSLAVMVFPIQFPDLSTTAVWIMGAAGAMGLFISIVLHELSHSLVARRFGLRIRGITLFIFGGVAEMESEPPSPKAEFWVAIAGPLTSFAIAGVLLVVAGVGVIQGWPKSVVGVIAYLGWINGLLAVFNLLPAFPLDGGRVFRAYLWHLRGNLVDATRITAMVGGWFGIAFFALGLVSLLAGDFIGGIWWFLIGMFLRAAASSSYQQVVMKSQLQGQPVVRFMKPTPITVDAATSVRNFVDDYLYHHDYKMYPVVEAGELVGCITSGDVKAIPRDQWEDTLVSSHARACSADNTVSPDTDAMEALAKMNQLGMSRMMVVDQGRLVGVLTLKDLLRFLAQHLELGDIAPTPPPARPTHATTAPRGPA